MELRRGKYVPRERREVAFADYYAPWAAARQIAVTRRYTDDQRAAKHVLPYWGSWPICDIRPSDIDDWIAILSRSMGPQSVRACYGLLRGPLSRTGSSTTPASTSCFRSCPACARRSTTSSPPRRSTGSSPPSWTPTPVTPG